MSFSSFNRARRAGFAIAAASLTLGLAACGDDDESTETSAESEATTEEAASTENIEVAATEYDFELSATPTADTKTFTFVNDGEEGHALIFARINEGFTLDEAFELQGRKGSAELLAEGDAGPGKTSEVTVKGPVEPGEYALLCPIGGPDGPHYKLGQLEEFAIE